MAKNKAKFNKFLTGAVTATMVATAVVPVAAAAETPSFSDVPTTDTHYKNITQAVERGLFSGHADGTFKPYNEITRGQVAKVLARYIVKQDGSESLEAYAVKHDLINKVSPFTDVPVTHSDSELVLASGIVKYTGVFTGSGNNLMPSKNITREQMAKVIVNAFGLEDLEGDLSIITDNDKAQVEFVPYINILSENGVTDREEFNPKGTVKRGQVASFLNRAYDVVNPAVEGIDVTAINAKTIEVKFGKANDAVAADFTVAKGTVNANIASVAISEDKKTATIEMTSKLTEGEYTVTVAQKDADALKGSVKVENEKVSKLEIASDVAPVTGPGATTATIGAKVLNQYGEDITKLNHSDVTVTVGGAATLGTLNSEGVLTLTLAPLAKEGESIFITLVHAKTGVSTQATVKISSAAAVSEIAFGELYNKDGKTLNQDTDFGKDKFYLPVTAKDQYGEDVTNLTKLNDELVITNTNPAVAAVNTTVKTVKIDNKDVNVVEVTGTNLAGSTNLIAVSKTTGANTSTTLKVEQGVKVASLTLNSPQELVTAGKDVLFPLTVIDTAGNELKTKKEFDALHAKDNINLSGGAASVVEVKDKGLFVKVAGTGVVKDTPITIVITSSTGKVSTQTVIPKEAAQATVITGISSKKATSLRAGDTTGVTIENTDLIVEDQYGQVITDKAVLGAIEFEVTADPNTVFDITTVTADKSYKIVATSPVDPEVKSSKLSFKILDASGNPVESSTFTKTFTVVEDAQFASYEVEDVKTIYAAEGDGTSGKDKEKFYVDAAYNQDIVVKAKTSAGEVVELTEGADFTVTGQPADDEEVKFAKDAKEAKVTVTITINRTGEQLTKELTYSNVEPKVTDFFFTATTSTDADKAKELEDIITVSTASNAFTIADLHTDEAQIVTTDQYGKKVFVTAVDTLTIVPSDASKVTITNNGTAGASVTATAATDITAKVKIGDVTKEIKVTVTP